MQEAENTIGNVKTSSQKGSYGDTSGKSANSLYKSYCTYMENNGRKPLDFKAWLTWAKSKNIVDPKSSADGSEQDVKEEVSKEVSNAQDGAKRTKRIIGGVLIFTMTCFLAYKAYDYYKGSKQN